MSTQVIAVERGTRADEPVSAAVIETVAGEAGVEPTALPPLYERVDPDALDTLFAARAAGAARTGEIEFTYFGYAVTVTCGDEITVALEER